MVADLAGVHDALHQGTRLPGLSRPAVWGQHLLDLGFHCPAGHLQLAV